MPDDLESSLRMLYARTAHGIKFGLEVERALLEAMGNPQAGLRFIHVAGTNGKGSVCSMVESVLRAAGYRTGLYTSPHLVRFNERIQVQGACISDPELANLLEMVEARDVECAQAPGGRPATFFELTTAMAFEHFRRQRADVVVLETGMGGRLDATNVVDPLLAVITPIGFDHTAWLGKTLAAIAAEKGGIIKPGRPLVCMDQPEEAMEALQRLAEERRAPVIRVADAVNVRLIRREPAAQKIKIETQSGSYRPVRLPLLGRYQLVNCAAAVAALEALAATGSVEWDEQALKTGLESVRWPGRCQVIGTNPPVILDVAHNPAGARALAESLRELAGKGGVALVAGLLSDKDARGFFRELAPSVRRCWLVPIDNERNMPADRLAAAAQAEGLSPERRSLPDALAEARAWAREWDATVCVAGSLFLAGEYFRLEGADPFG